MTRPQWWEHLPGDLTTTVVSQRRRCSSASVGVRGDSSVSPVSTSIPKGAHAHVEVNGRQNFKSLFAGKARRHNDTAYIPRRKEIIVWDVVCVPRSPTLVRKDTDGCLDVKSRNCDWHRESHKNETWRLRSDMLHCASLEHGSSSLLHCAAPKLTKNIDQELQV